MKNTPAILAFSLLLCLLTSCLNKNEDTTTYSEALVSAFYFASNDSFPGLGEASFTIITSSDTGMIYNKDSLRFGTSLDSVIPTIGFNYTPSYAIFYTQKDGIADTTVYSGSDTISFNARPTRLFVMASDNETGKWYDIFVNVHQVDPDLYTWEQIHSGIFQLDGAESKAVLLKGVFYLFVNDGFKNRLYTSADAKTWSAVSLSGLPDNCGVRSILATDSLLYYADSTSLYTSANATDWTMADYSSESFQLMNMLYAFNDSIWAIAEQKSSRKLELVNMAPGGRLAATGTILPDNFPISDFSACVFASASNRRRAIVMGGFDRTGTAQNSRWNIEFLYGRGYSMTDFTVEQPSFKALSGASLIWYNNQLHLFGGVNADNELRTDQLTSDDEGLNWFIPDSAKNMLPLEYPARQKASVLVDDQHYIYIIGGHSRTETFSDVYRGRLNKTTFVIKD